MVIVRLASAVRSVLAGEQIRLAISFIASCLNYETRDIARFGRPELWRAYTADSWGAQQTTVRCHQGRASPVVRNERLAVVRVTA